MDPSIFELEDGPPPGAGEDGGRVAGHIGPGGAGVPGPGPADTLLERFPGPLGERDGKRLQRAVCNRLFEQYGKDRLTPDEEEFGGEAWAAVANYYLAQVDPNSPWGAWFLAVAVTAGPRFLPDVWDGISRRVRGEDPRPDPDPGAEPPPSSPEVDEPRDEGHRPSGWTALEGLPE
ncbi:MAG: hypothetical protein GWO00_18055 [Gemmatimonadetes bacterium]|nr:hypothetical protein [Gemmatimonadota bacterium]NIU32745.1 hypothetical protein [Gemmatimonadota bacterium]NIU37177.1 hypothetical protein [Gemmatimonadota bacterium]NIV63113.1 hypothetical protein [Gemmatimonadota bacterium]NIV84119.1 hypothetical protein [Gemmatimonadota bacterium]